MLGRQGSKGPSRPKLLGPDRPLLATLFAETAPLDVRLLGRTLMHAAAVGAVAGVAGAILFAGLEYLQRLLLEELTGYVALRAAGETFAAGSADAPFKPWLLVFLPAVGGLACGLVSWR